MRNPVLKASSDVADAFDVAKILGQSEAFGAVAGRCSAARAEALRRLRDEKKYRRVSPTWRSFCAAHLNLSGGQADRIVALWEEFGAAYFEVAQLARISADTYRAIQPQISDGALHVEGEVIELIPENARRVAAAVSKLRYAMPRRDSAPERKVPRRLEVLDKRSHALIAEFQALAKMNCGREDGVRFETLLDQVSEALQQLEADLGLLIDAD